ncbi:MAG TPA: hypothetical protein VHU83_05085 [Bryobacteraceae bacterium]|jgi:hypothetical protein|nr:hypothetical protein [Bryobacteraceae bacterium]
MASEPLAAEESPFYVRWSPEHSRFAIELKLPLVAKISSELDRNEKLDIEIGGVLIGNVLGGRVPTLRIENVEILPRGVENGGIYIPGPDHLARLEEVRKTARAQHRTALGFFRSHCRPGPLNPSLADRSLLSTEFKNSAYALLLIQASAPRTAAFFVAENGELPNDASVREFRFNEAAFKALPEVEAEAATGLAERSEPAQHSPRNWYIGAALAGLLIVLGALWLAAGTGTMPDWLATGSRQLDLKVTGSDRRLKISWNHDARQMGPASTGTVAIVDGASRRDIKLGADELKMGSVEYDGAGRRVEVTMTVNTPESAPLSEAAKWPPP